MKIAICSDSSLDLSKELLQENNIIIKPFGITLGDNSYLDGVDVTKEQVFEFVDKTKTLPKTNAINIAEYQEFFAEVLKDYDKVISFSLSSEFSSSYNNAFLASKEFDGNVQVIDSRSLSTGVGMLVLYACSLRDAGVDFSEICEKVHARRNAVQASFVIEKLDYLYKGGRCNSVQLLGANLLKIRPSILVSNGKMGMHNKYRGNMIDVVDKYCRDTLAEFNTPHPDYCFITYSTATPEMLADAEKVVKESGKFKNIYYAEAGATVTSHCGKNTIGILYYNDGDNN
jgi:DegV family protein with EDD domain